MNREEIEKDKLRAEYFKQTGFDVYSTVSSGKATDYINWLENKLISLTHTEGEEKYSKDDMIRFAYWLRNGLTNLEYAKKRTESHLEYWLDLKEKNNDF